MKIERALGMYTGCAFSKDWKSGVLEVKHTAYAENLVVQYGIEMAATILGSPVVDRPKSPRKEGEPGGGQCVSLYRSMIGSLM